MNPRDRLSYKFFPHGSLGRVKQLLVFLTFAISASWVAGAPSASAQDTTPPAEHAIGLSRSLPVSIAKRRLRQPSKDAPTELIKVVGGKNAEKDQFKWQVALILSESPQDDPFSGQFCGATLIRWRWVLTAAHCTYDDNPLGENFPPVEIAANKVDAYLGSYDFTAGQRIGVKRIVRHERYDPVTQDNDIALLELDSEPSNRSQVELLRLVVNGNEAAIEPPSTATVVGWGSTSHGVVPRKSSVLLYADNLQFMQPESCNAYYIGHLRSIRTTILKRQGKSDGEIRAALDQFYPLNMQLISDNMVCAGIEDGSSDACFGDSGGPLVVLSGGVFQVGVVSWGPIDGCGITNLFGVYVKLSKFGDWITAQAGPAPDCPQKRLPSGNWAPPDWCDAIHR